MSLTRELSLSGGWPRWFWRQWDALPQSLRFAIGFVLTMLLAWALGSLASRGIGG
jgi:hypothetical protein